MLQETETNEPGTAEWRRRKRADAALARYHAGGEETRKRRRVASLTPEQAQKKRDKAREYARTKRAQWTDADREAHRAKQREQHANLTPQQRAEKLAKMAAYDAKRRAENPPPRVKRPHKRGTPEERARRAERARAYRANMTPEQRAEKKRKAQEYRARETSEQRAKRRAKQRARWANTAPEQRAMKQARDAAARIARLAADPEGERKRAADRRKRSVRADPVAFKIRTMVRDAKKRRPDDFDLTAADVQMQTVCPYLGIAIDWEPYKGRQRNASPTLDRICPEYGYMRGNVLIVSLLGNRMKSCLDSGDQLALALADFKTELHLREAYGAPGEYVRLKIEKNTDDGAPYYHKRWQAMNGCHERAKAQNVPFNLRTTDAPPIDLCAVSGVPMDWGKGGGTNAASLDKIIPAYGYVPGNVRWVTRAANGYMQNATPAQRLRFARVIENTRAELWRIYGPRSLLPPLIRADI